MVPSRTPSNVESIFMPILSLKAGTPTSASFPKSLLDYTIVFLRLIFLQVSYLDDSAKQRAANCHTDLVNSANLRQTLPQIRVAHASPRERVSPSRCIVLL